MSVVRIDGRVKIPLKFAKILQMDKSHLVRVNQGKRQLSEDAAIQVLAVFRAHGIKLHITDILPRLKRLQPYLCEPCQGE